MARKVEYEFGVDMAAYAKSMRAALNTAGQLDKAFNNLLRSVRQLENAAIKMTVDTSALDRAKADINTIDGATPNVEVVVDSSEINEAQSEVDTLDGATPDVDVVVDKSEVDEAQSEVAALDGATPDVKVEVDDSSVAKARATVERSFLGIPLVLDVTGIPDLISKAIGGIKNAPVVGNIIDANEAKRQFEAALIAMGRSPIDEFFGFEDIFDRVIASGLATSQTELAALSAQAVSAGVEIDGLESTLTTTLGVAKITGKDATESFTILSTLVRTGLATSFTEAGDLVARAGNNIDNFVEGAEEFGAKMTDAGFTGAQALAVFNEATKAGVQNSGRLGEVFNELPNIINEAAGALESGDDNPFLKALGDVGMTADPATLARASDDTLGFIDDVVTNVNAQIASGDITPVEGDALINAIFGSPAGEIGASIFRNIDFGAALRANDTMMVGLEDALAPLQDTVSASVSRLATIITTELGDAFTLAGKPLTDLLDGIPDKLNTISDLIASGVGIPEALEIALEAPGLAETLRQLQANIGGFMIEFQLAIADLLTGLGRGDAAAGLRSSAAAAAQGQLAFDLQFLDPDSTASSIATALRRGVDQAGIDEAIIEAGSHLIDEEQGKKFQLILEELAGTAFLPTTITAGGLLQQSQSQLLPVDPDEITQTMGAIESAIGENWFSNQWADFGEAITFDTDALYESAAGIEAVGMRTAESDDALINYGDSVSDTSDKLTVLGDRAGTFETKTSAAFETAATRAEVAMDRIVASVIEAQTVMAGAGIDVTAYAAYVFGSGGTGTFESSENPEHRATGGGVNAGQPYRVGERGWEYFIPGMDGAIIPHDISAMLANLPMGGGGSSVVNNTVNLYSTMNNPTQAASVGAANELSRQARGYF